ncbi:riboflavin kinase / FMN adenylyltransferase [Spiroplasma chinense]|uniref:FAD synthase n=1 Tax=Spiroplasma chinense TaxID=216932 RepID=A0A5B9Y4J9_9MOLU|nr:hypothetical protein [Spiroplasma chinense]QEH61735.1 riboflavin kinase / FMN adenylyltransferase [Spiroplasma chinense]
MLKKNLYIVENEFKQDKKPYVVCIGFFDGLHKIHNEIIEKTKEIAEEQNEAWSVITFSEKVTDYLNNVNNNIQSKVIKYKLIESRFNPNYLFEIQVNESTTKKTKEEFINYLKNTLCVQKIVVGSDFKFGFKGLGTVEDLKEAFGEENVIIFERDLHYSTTELKELLENGQVEVLNQRIGTNFKLFAKKNPFDGDESFGVIDMYSKIQNGNYEVLVDGTKRIAQFENNKIFFKEFVVKPNIEIEMIKKL